MTAPLDPPPLRPVPAVTPVMLPASVDAILDANPEDASVKDPLISVDICAEELIAPIQDPDIADAN